MCVQHSNEILPPGDMTPLTRGSVHYLPPDPRFGEEIATVEESGNWSRQDWDGPQGPQPEIVTFADVAAVFPDRLPHLLSMQRGALDMAFAQIHGLGEMARASLRDDPASLDRHVRELERVVRIASIIRQQLEDVHGEG